MAKFTKSEVLDIILDLEDDVQAMREEGEHDMRTVLHLISRAYSKIGKLEVDKND